MAGTSVRDAVPGQDAAGCLAIYAPFVHDTAVSFETEVPTEAAMAERIAASARSYAWLVLDAGGTVGGYAYASAHRTRAAYRWAADVSVYLAAAHRGTGAARSLYAQLFARLIERGVQTVCAGITLPNEASVGFHRAMGFESVGVYRRIGYKAGSWHDVSWWQRDLVPVGQTPPAEPRTDADV